MIRAVIATVALITILMRGSVLKAEENRIALIIGNGAYALAPLESPEFDEAAIAKKLNALRYDVEEDRDLTRIEMFNAIRRFGEKLNRTNATGIFYYSGHGIQVNNRNYMIPVDAIIRSEPDVELWGVPLDNVLARMQIAKSRPNIVILDACRNNPFEKNYKSISGGKGLALESPAPGTVIAYAAAPGHTAEPGLAGQLSKYTQALVRLIDAPSQDVVAMLRQVQDAVYESTNGRQQPYVEVSPGVPSFFLNSATSMPPTKESMPPTKESSTLQSIAVGNAALANAKLVGNWHTSLNDDVSVNMKILPNRAWSSETLRQNNVIRQAKGIYTQTPAGNGIGTIVFTPTQVSSKSGSVQTETDQYELSNNGRQLKLTSAGDTMVFERR
jgi:Caspase domain